jgi:hypothetical protein
VSGAPKPCPVCGHPCRGFKSHILSPQEYIERVHEGGSGGYGIATHDVLIYHDKALRLEACLQKERELKGAPR